MELDALIQAVGAQRYQRFRELAWSDARWLGPNTWEGLSPDLAERVQDPALGSWGTVADDAAMVPHELEEWIWEWPDEPMDERIRTSFRLYRDAPHYSVLNVLFTNTVVVGRDVPELAWDLLWDEIRRLLRIEDERLAAPVTYSLRVDWFAYDRSTTEEAWKRVVSGTLSDRGLERLLLAAAPVPYALKDQLFETPRLREHRWGPWILRCLSLSCAPDGHIDPLSALRLLGRVRVPPSMMSEADAMRDYLEARLAGQDQAAERSARVRLHELTRDSSDLARRDLSAPQPPRKGGGAADPTNINS